MAFKEKHLLIYMGLIFFAINAILIELFKDNTVLQRLIAHSATVALFVVAYFVNIRKLKHSQKETLQLIDDLENLNH